MRKFTDPASMAASYVELEKKIGQKGLVLPGEGASPAEVREAMTALGCPDSPEKYSVAAELPEGMSIHEEMLATMKQRAWDSGLSTQQWEQQFGTFVEAQKAQYAAQVEAWKENIEATNTALREQYGSAYESKLHQAEQTATALFGDDAAAIRGLPIPGGSMLGNHPLFIKALAELGEKLKEHEILPGLPTRNTKTAEEAKRELEQLDADPDHVKAYLDPNHAGHQLALKKRDSLYRAIYTEGQTGSAGSASGNLVG